MKSEMAAFIITAQQASAMGNREQLRRSAAHFTPLLFIHYLSTMRAVHPIPSSSRILKKRST
jgi:hypothetical protein